MSAILNILSAILGVTSPTKDIGYDHIVLGMLEDDTPISYYMRNRPILDALPDSVGTVEFWAHHYEEGSHPVDGRYTWRHPAMIRILKGYAQSKGRRAIFYVHPSLLTQQLGPEKAMKYIIDMCNSLGGWDGIYFDGVPPYGIDSKEAVPYLNQLRKLLPGKYILIHASGAVYPGEYAKVADTVFFGEFGGGTGPTCPYPHTWGQGDWVRLDNLAHPQYITYVRALIDVGALPIYKMASCHKMGTAEGYPDNWPTNKDWDFTSSMYGPLRIWCWYSVNPRFHEVQQLRDKYNVRFHLRNRKNAIQSDGISSDIIPSSGNVLPKDKS